MYYKYMIATLHATRTIKHNSTIIRNPIKLLLDGGSCLAI